MTIMQDVDHVCYRDGDFATIDTKLKNIADDISDIKKALAGNGRPGIIERVSNMEVGIKISYVIIGISIAILGIFVTLAH